MKMDAASIAFAIHWDRRTEAARAEALELHLKILSRQKFERAGWRDRYGDDVRRERSHRRDASVDRVDVRHVLDRNLHVGDDPALTGFRRRGAAAAEDFTLHNSHAARPAMTGSTIMRNVNSVLQRGIE